MQSYWKKNPMKIASNSSNIRRSDNKELKAIRFIN